MASVTLRIWGVSEEEAAFFANNIAANVRKELPEHPPHGGWSVMVSERDTPYDEETTDAIALANALRAVLKVTS
jgi:hypothetical protein